MHGATIKMIFKLILILANTTGWLQSKNNKKGIVRNIE